MLVNLGPTFPGQLLKFAVKGDAKAVEVDLDGKIVAVSGQVTDKKGKPEIIVTGPNQLKVQ